MDGPTLDNWLDDPAAVENVRANVAALSRPEIGRTLLEEAERLERDATEARG